MKLLRQLPQQKVVIEINFPVLLALFALVLMLGWVDGYRRRGEVQRLEAQNARIIQLLEGAEITQAPTVSLAVN